MDPSLNFLLAHTAIMTTVTKEVCGSDSLD